MTEEEKDEELTETDAIWELKKMNRRLLDVWDEIDTLKATDKSLNAKISRVWSALRRDREEGEEGFREEREEIPIRDSVLSQLNEEQRALLIAKYLDLKEAE